MLITFEGIDGVGKTYQAQKFTNFLIGEYGRDKVVITQEPYGFVEIKKVLLNYPLYIKTELFLFIALRNEHYLTIIKPFLSRGRIVVCDRYIDSTIAYQGYGAGLDIDFINQLNNHVIEDTLPDLTFILDAPISCVRKQKCTDRFECKSDKYFENVKNGFREIAKKDPARCRLIYRQDDYFDEEIFINLFKEVYNAKL